MWNWNTGFFAQDLFKSIAWVQDASTQDVGSTDNTAEKLTEPWASLAKFGITPETAFGMVQNLILVAFLAFAGWIVAGFASRMVKGALQRAKLDVTLSLFFAKMSRWLVLLLTFLAILNTFGIETTSLAAVIGATSLAIGLAFQGTLANFAAGVMLLIFRPFKVGDTVEVNGTRGTVTEIELFTTSLDTPDNRRFIVPNGNIFGSTIENVTHHNTRRCDVAVGVCYSADIDHTKVVLTEAIQGIEGVLNDPEPVVYLVELGASSVDWSVRTWCKTSDYWKVRERLTRAVKMSLDNAGISIPFPQMDVHLDQPLGT